MASYPKALLERWFLQTLVKKVGYYAIALYSGYLLPPAVADAGLEPESDALAKRPLRVLVAGQTKAGKSSLINALLGEFRSTVDVLPVSDQLRVYTLRNPELGDVLLYDSPGYGEEDFWFQNDEDLLSSFDLVIVVCSAVHAGRAADSRFLEEVRAWFGKHLERRMPPVLAVVSHVDQLRPFREWQPPYDLDQPGNAKAENISAAVDAVADALHLSRPDCVPVCLAVPAESYNLEAVLAGIVVKLPDSLRTQYLRILSEGRRKEKTLLLLKQFGIWRNR